MVFERKRSMAVLALAFIVINIWFIPAGAQDDGPTVPAPIGFVNDYADQCTASQEADLLSRIESIEADTTVEIAAVTYADCGDDPFRFRVDIFNEWGIGKKGNDNGLLLLACLNDPDLQQEVGYGLEGVLPDLLTKKKSDELYIPRAQGGNVCQGLIDLVDGYGPILRGAQEEVEDKTEKDATGAILGIGLFLVVWLGGAILIGVFVGPEAGIEWLVRLPLLVLRLALLSKSSGKRSSFGGGRSGGAGSG